MSLEKELSLNVPFTLKSHESLLNIYFTGTCIKKQATEFLSQFDLTAVQINLMMMLGHQADESGGTYTPYRRLTRSTHTGSA